MEFEDDTRDASAKCSRFHARRRFYKHTLSGGGGYHIIERCDLCGANVRGTAWVSRSSVRWHGDLVEDPWRDGKDPQQGVLL
jgi:hypothetical protein